MPKRIFEGREDRRRGTPVLNGLMIGLMIGLLFAIVVALVVKSNNPFKSPDQIPVAPATPTPLPVEPLPVDPAPAPAPAHAPGLDFYKVLPGDTPAAPPEPSAPTPKPARYFLQAGAFQDADDADNLKAQLALLGIEAQIQTSVIPDKGVMHRVRIGPFKAMDAVNNTRALLIQNNIDADLVKESSSFTE